MHGGQAGSGAGPEAAAGGPLPVHPDVGEGADPHRPHEAAARRDPARPGVQVGDFGPGVPQRRRLSGSGWVEGAFPTHTTSLSVHRWGDWSSMSWVLWLEGVCETSTAPRAHVFDTHLTLRTIGARTRTAGTRLWHTVARPPSVRLGCSRLAARCSCTVFGARRG